METVNILTVVAFNIVLAVDGFSILEKAYNGKLAGKAFSIFSWSYLGWGILNAILLLLR